MTTLQSHQEAGMQGFVENLPGSLGWKAVTLHQDPHPGPKSVSLAAGSSLSTALRDSFCCWKTSPDTSQSGKTGDSGDLCVRVSAAEGRNRVQLFSEGEWGRIAKETDSHEG